MGIQIHLAPDEGTPIYLQIVNQIKYLVASGRLERGEALPPVRVLAEQLLINPNTVARAYRELEREGIVTTRRTSGTYISAGGSPLPLEERLKMLTERADALLVEAWQMDIDTEDVIALLREREEAMRVRPLERQTHE